MVMLTEINSVWPSTFILQQGEGGDDCQPNGPHFTPSSVYPSLSKLLQKAFYKLGGVTHWLRILMASGSDSLRLLSRGAFVNSGNLKISHVADVWVSMAPQIPGIDTWVTDMTIWELWGKDKTPLEAWASVTPPRSGQTLLSSVCFVFPEEVELYAFFEKNHLFSFTAWNCLLCLNPLKSTRIYLE